MTTCPDCGVLPNNPHESGCDIARCLKCGFQRISCDCLDGARDTWTGKYPGTEDCERFGFWCVETGIPGSNFKRVPAGTPGAYHDLNRLYAETVWRPLTRTRELRMPQGADMARQKDFKEANDQLRYLLNELKAIDENDSLMDRKSICKHLMYLHQYIEEGGPAPDAIAIIKELATLPIQA